MAEWKKLAVLVVLLAAPALLFAQEQAPQAAGAQAGEAAGGMMMRLSEGVDIALSNEAGDVKGMAKDAVVDAEGNIPFVVMSFGEEADLYLVPADSIQPAADGQSAMLSLAAADVQGLQKLEGGQLPAGSADQYLATQVQGVAVVDAQGQTLGSIQDAVLDLEARKIDSLVIVSAGELGLGQGMFAVPLDRIAGIDAEKGQVTVNMSVEELRASPVE